MFAVPLLCPLEASAARGVRDGLRPQADARWVAPGAKGRFVSPGVWRQPGVAGAMASALPSPAGLPGGRAWGRAA